jgi:large subunit ribosomal protein L1
MAEAKKTSSKKEVASTKLKTEKIEATVNVEVAPEIVETEVIEPVVETAAEEVKTTKAGKRSPKALKEAEAKEAKEERKQSGEASAEAPKQAQKPARSRLERRGKNYRKLAEQIDKDKQYTLKEAVDLAVKTSPVKFDASVELHMNLSVDPRQADQNIRGSVALPAGTGKTVKITVLTADAKDIEAALKAGADVAGSDDILASLEKGVIDFDILIATPAMMPKLGKYARVLGPKGLMPNPKSGTVTPDVVKAVTEAKAGRVEFRVDSTGIIHLALGKVSFGADKLMQNTQAVVSAIKSAKPASLKGAVFIKSIHMTTTMGPSIKIAVSETN